MNLIVRLFLLLAAPVTALFVSRDTLKFDILQVIIAVIVFTGLVAVAAFWPRRSKIDPS